MQVSHVSSVAQAAGHIAAGGWPLKYTGQVDGVKPLPTDGPVPPPTTHDPVIAHHPQPPVLVQLVHDARVQFGGKIGTPGEDPVPTCRIPAPAMSGESAAASAKNAAAIVCHTHTHTYTHA